MNILYLTHRIPYPPTKGDKLRSFHQLRALCDAHDVWCACFVDEPADMKHVATIEQMCRGVRAIPISKTAALFRGARSLLGGKTVTEGFYDHAAMRSQIEDWSCKVDFDVAVAFSSSMVPYVPLAGAPRTVVDLCDVDSLKWLAYAGDVRFPRSRLFQIEGSRLAALEQAAARDFDATILISSAERDAFLAGGGFVHPARVHVVGNGAEVPAEAHAPRQISRTDAPVLGFVGAMDYAPNVDAACWFAARAFPFVRALYPAATFRIVGRNPSKSVRTLGRITGVEVVGEVESVHDEILRFDVSVAPLRIARGLQNKVLEAMAAGLPVVLTPEAAEGIDADNGKHFLIERGEADFAGAIAHLLADRERRSELGASARSFVSRNHVWQTEMQRYEWIVTGQKDADARAKDLAAAPTMAANETSPIELPTR